MAVSNLTGGAAQSASISRRTVCPCLGILTINWGILTHQDSKLHSETNIPSVLKITATLFIVYLGFFIFMFDDLILPKIWPIGLVLFNTLFFLVAIPIEAFVFHKRLNFDKKSSIFYAIAVNLFSGVLGWLIFFFVESRLPTQLKTELINFVFFNTLKSTTTQGILIFTTITIFFSTLLMKFFLLRFFVYLLNEDFTKKREEQPTLPRSRFSFFSKAQFQNTNLVTTTIIANSLSYTAITIIIVLRNR